MNSILRQIVRKSGKYLTENWTHVRLRPTAINRRWYSPSWGPNKAPVDRKDIEFRVIQSLGKHDKIDLNSIKLDSKLVADLGLDSLDVVECVVHLEDEFKVEFQDKDVDQLTSVSSVVDYVVRLLDSVVDQNQRPDIEFLEGMTMNRPNN